MKLDHINNASLPESLIKRLIKWWLLFLVLVLPFQTKIIVLLEPISKYHAQFIGSLDELTILFLLPPALIKIYANKEYPIRLHTALLFPVVLLVISGLISGLLNENAFYVTALGIFSYIEWFLVVFIFAAFFQNNNEIRHFFHILIRLAIILVVVALIQETWAMTTRYILEMENYDISNWRFGIYRPASLMRSPNVFGLYILLIFTIYLSLSKKINYLIFILLLSGIILSLSRIVSLGLIFLCIAQIYRKNKSFLILLAPMLVLLIMIFAINMNFNKRADTLSPTDMEVSSYSEYRKQTRQTAITIWKDNIFFGTGPGMFGGDVSLKYTSRIYGEYDYSEKIMWHLKRTGHVDQFWFQLLAEMGIMGVIAFCILFTNIIIVLLILRIWASSDYIGNLFVGLLIIVFTIILFSLFTGLSNTSLLFTFSAIIGMAIGGENEQYR